MPARSHSVGGSLSPSRAICPQIQIGKPTLPEHGAIASQAGDGDCERLLQTSKTGEGRTPVRSAELEPGDGGIAAIPADGWLSALADASDPSDDPSPREPVCRFERVVGGSAHRAEVSVALPPNCDRYALRDEHTEVLLTDGGRGASE